MGRQWDKVRAVEGWLSMWGIKETKNDSQGLRGTYSRGKGHRWRFTETLGRMRAGGAYLDTWRRIRGKKEESSVYIWLEIKG